MVKSHETEIVACGAVRDREKIKVLPKGDPKAFAFHHFDEL